MDGGADDGFWLATVPPQQHGIWAAPGAGTTLLAAARAATHPDGPMPDDPPPQGPGDGIRWAPGALSGTMAMHTRAAEQAQRPFLSLARLVLDQQHGRVTRRAVEEAYEALKPVQSATPRDMALAMTAVGRPSAEPTAAWTEALSVVCGWLVTRGAHRGPVKAGLAAAACMTWDRLVPCAADLGRLTELSLEACTFLANQHPAREAELLTLARWHHGWGRIHAVRALGGLAERTADVDDWLVDDGWRNSVHSGYTAPLIAGRVDVASRVLMLSPDGTPERGRLDSVRGLMEALLDEHSPGAHMADVPRMLELVDQWFRALSLLPSAALTIQDLVFVQELHRHILNDTAGLGAAFGEPDDERIMQICDELLGEDRARAAVEAALATPEGPHFLAAARLAPAFRLDPVPGALQRLSWKPDDSTTWFWLAERHGQRLGVALIDFALRTLPPDLVTSTQRMPGARHDPDVHMAVQALWQWPGRTDPEAGWRLVEALLKSPAHPARERGATLLRHLPPAALRQHADALARLAGQEPDEGVRASIAAALTGPR